MAATDNRYDGLVGTVLLAATPDDPVVAGTWILVTTEVLSVVMEEDELGLLTPLFTSPEALTRWRPEGGCYAERPAAWHFGVAASDPSGRVAIDPGSPSSVVLEPAEVAILAQGRSPADAGSGAVLIATPVESLPEPVAVAVREALAAEAAVRSARLFLVDATGTGTQPMVMVELDPGLDDAGIGEAMGRLVQDVAARSDEAGGLTFTVVTDEWRSTYEAGGIVLHAP